MCGLTTALDVGTAVEEFSRLRHQVSMVPSATGPTTTADTTSNHPTEERDADVDRQEAHIDVRRKP